MTVKSSLTPIVANNNIISKIQLKDMVYDIKATEIDFTEDMYERIFKAMQDRMNFVPMIHHNCFNCGGTLELRTDKHVFVCPYCNSAFAIGTKQINS